MVHKLLIIGAGFGGNGVIHGLMEAERNSQDEAGVSSPTSLFAGELEITLLDRKTMLSIGGTWQFMWSSRLSQEQKIEWPLTDLQANHLQNVQLIAGNDDARVETLDIPEKRVQLSNGKSIEFDTLVLAPGVISDPSGLPGLVPANCDYSDPTRQALDVCNIQHVSLIQRGIDQVLEQAKTSMQTILICVTRVPYKCPPLPFEVASLVDDLRRERGVLENVKILLSIPVQFPFAGPPAEAFFKDLLQQQSIEFLPNHEVREFINGTTVDFTVVDGSSTSKQIKADLILATFPQRAPDFCQPLCGPHGYIPVNLQTNKVESITTAPVYAIGDVCHAMFPKPKKPHPKAGEFAFQMGVHVANQIVAALKNQSIAPPAREASCVAECGLDGKGVKIQPNFTEILASPETALPQFAFPVIENAASQKQEWVNGYLHKFFARDKVPKFGPV